MCDQCDTFKRHRAYLFKSWFFFSFHIQYFPTAKYDKFHQKLAQIHKWCENMLSFLVFQMVFTLKCQRLNWIHAVDSVLVVLKLLRLVSTRWSHAKLAVRCRRAIGAVSISCRTRSFLFPTAFARLKYLSAEVKRRLEKISKFKVFDEIYVSKVEKTVEKLKWHQQKIKFSVFLQMSDLFFRECEHLPFEFEKCISLIRMSLIWETASNMHFIQSTQMTLMLSQSWLSSININLIRLNAPTMSIISIISTISMQISVFFSHHIHG